MNTCIPSLIHRLSCRVCKYFNTSYSVITILKGFLCQDTISYEFLSRDNDTGSCLGQNIDLLTVNVSTCGTQFRSKIS